MSQIVVYENCGEGRGEHIERVMEIYESADCLSGQNPKTEKENTNMKTQHTGTPKVINEEQKCSLETEDTKGSQIQMQNLGADKKVSRCYTVTVVCLLLLCVLLLALITVLCIKFNNLNMESDQLQSNNSILINQMNQLQKEKDRVQRMLADMDTFIKQGWKYFNGSFYSITTTPLKPWNESRQDCINKGADLVIINSIEEEAFIVNQLNNKEGWIGLNDIETEGDFKWVDGSPLTIRFWYPLEPNNFNSIEDCVKIETDQRGKQWNDVPCNFSFIWICEKNVLQP